MSMETTVFLIQWTKLYILKRAQNQNYSRTLSRHLFDNRPNLLNGKWFTYQENSVIMTIGLGMEVSG